MSIRLTIAISLLFLVAATLAPTISMGAANPPIYQYSLMPGLQCSLTSEGSLVFSLGDTKNASSRVILEGGVVPPDQSRRPNPKTMRMPFKAMVRQGATDGRRGFSAMADDDGDGWVDEDILDGRDNDGDGSTDEDYAAISDAMVVVDTHDGHQGTHLEFYHWVYPQLNSSVFVDVAIRNAIDEPMSGWWRFQLPESQWRETDVSSMRHGLSGRPELMNTSAFVSEVPGLLDSGSLWLGVVVLDNSALNFAGKLGQRVRLEKGMLDIPSGEGSIPVVVCAARSWLQLSRALCEAQSVYKGTTDPISGFHVPWIVFPGCTPCRNATPPVVEWKAVGDTGLRLNFQVHEGMNVNYDPDVFSVYGIYLGSPESILWSTKELPFASRVWALADLTKISADPTLFNDPYSSFSGLDGHSATGVLGFEFSNVPDKILSNLLNRTESYTEGVPINASYMDGRQVHFSAHAADGGEFVVATAIIASPETGLTTPSDLKTIDQLTLSSELLDGYPNPFKDSITIRFNIPQTLGEAFQLPNGKEWPSGWNKSDAVPWDRGSPSVSVKIYNINGQELRTLHEGNHSSGEFTVGWDGRDAFGRKVASGTYFCKLQLEKWSTTRRVIFLR